MRALAVIAIFCVGGVLGVFSQAPRAQFFPSQSISSIQLSGTATTTGLASGTAVGTLSVPMSPPTPTFSYTGTNLHLSTSGSDSGGVCNPTNGANNGSFQIGSGDTLETNGTLTTGSNAVCVAAGETGVSATGQAFTITVGNLINAAATYCASNGGGNGSSGSPWQDVCIQAAVNAASNGDTVFLAAGNWALNTGGTFVNITKSLNLIGAGSGNTFDAYGHPNNAGGTDLCPSTSITCVATTGSSTCATISGRSPAGNVCTGGAIAFSSCSNVSVSHIFFDGSTATAGGDANATLNFHDCSGPITVSDIRLLTFNMVAIDNAETQFYATFINTPQSACTAPGTGLNVYSSVFAEPLVDGGYPSTNVYESVFDSGETVKNNVFWQFAFNPTDDDCVTFTGNSTILTAASWDVEYGVTGCIFDPGNIAGYTCPTNGDGLGQQGTFHATTSNNYFDATGLQFGTGAGVNDIPTNGGVSDLHWTGNWVFASTGALDSCVWRVYRACSGSSMAVNATASSTCTSSNNGNPFDVTNNSIIATTSAQLNAQGTSTTACFDAANPTGTTMPVFVYNYTAQKNYLSSRRNQYNSNTNTVSPTVTGNFCAGGSTFTQTDSTQCATTGFTTLPTVSFTLSPLSGTTVPFATTNFTAQYGAVEWLASTSSTTPTSSGQSGTGAAWSYTPPVSLSVTHGNTVYMWVMDSANNISSVATALVP
jgi:hypothetical protein